MDRAREFAVYGHDPFSQVAWADAEELCHIVDSPKGLTLEHLESLKQSVQFGEIGVFKQFIGHGIILIPVEFTRFTAWPNLGGC
ncbi:hypothetical protein, partial [Haloferax sp. KTX1]|uniref:hypothetical protein n=1 Tax=Haloferax sp. KTX1 TaxID=2600597 RepID=UPI001C9E2AF6